MNVTIPSPCSQSWATMQPTSAGRFCGNCQKTVVDFSAMSDAGIRRQLQRSTGKVCGRFTAHQVNRPLALARPSYSLSFPKTLLGVSLLLGGTIPESRAKTIGLPINQQTIQASSQHVVRTYHPAETNLSDSLRVVRGRVISGDDGELLPGVNIVIKGTNFGTNSNEKGEFVLGIPNELDTISTVLVFRFIGFQTNEVALGQFKNNATLTLNLSVDILGEIVCSHKPTVWQRIKTVFRGR